MTTPHRIHNPDALAPPSGFAHAIEAAPGRTVYLGGQAAHDGRGEIASDDLVEQFGAACRNVVGALAAAGGRPEHLVSLHVYVTDAERYRAAAKEVGAAYREHFGRHYPALALFEVAALFDARAKVELVGIAVVPDT